MNELNELGNWIAVDPQMLAKNTTRTTHGIRLVVSPSPSDIPEAVRGFYETVIRKFVIEFRYIGERQEPLDVGSETGDVRLLIGRHSQRLYRIEIDVEKIEGQHLSFQIQAPQEVDAAVKRLGERPRTTYRTKYEPVRETLSSKRVSLFSSIGSR